MFPLHISLEGIRCHSHTWQKYRQTESQTERKRDKQTDYKSLFFSHFPSLSSSGRQTFPSTSRLLRVGVGAAHPSMRVRTRARTHARRQADEQVERDGDQIQSTRRCNTYDRCTHSAVFNPKREPTPISASLPNTLRGCIYVPKIVPSYMHAHTQSPTFTIKKQITFGKRKKTPAQKNA
mmetsp:Transcript_50976/g.100200  ORF Transcript_50976/g.100200 Transcript_50976/m.100200 type:complete len:179 (-) Transcript_50976:14-550(-)